LKRRNRLERWELRDGILTVLLFIEQVYPAHFGKKKEICTQYIWGDEKFSYRYRVRKFFLIGRYSFFFPLNSLLRLYFRHSRFFASIPGNENKE